MVLNLSVPELKELKPKITVIGVGGAGGNAINNMIDLTRVLPWRWRTFNEYFLFF